MGRRLVEAVAVRVGLRLAHHVVQLADAERAALTAGEHLGLEARHRVQAHRRQLQDLLDVHPAGHGGVQRLAQVRGLKAGDISPTLLRSGAGFHVVKLIARSDSTGVPARNSAPNTQLSNGPPSSKSGAAASSVAKSESRAARPMVSITWEFGLPTVAGKITLATAPCMSPSARVRP